MLYNYLWPDLANLTSLSTRLTSRGTAGERLGHCLLVFREESDNLLRRQTLSSLFYVSKKQFKGTVCSFTPSFKRSSSLPSGRIIPLCLLFLCLSSCGRSFFHVVGSLQYCCLAVLGLGSRVLVPLNISAALSSEYACPSVCFILPSLSLINGLKLGP